MAKREQILNQPKYALEQILKSQKYSSVDKDVIKALCTKEEYSLEEIEKVLTSKKIKVIEIQRSKGYSTRKSINIDKTEKVIELIKRVSPNTIVMIDNCYCEFVCKKEPTEVGADIVVGSLIKNLGGGIASNGGYICGRSDLIHLCAERLNVTFLDVISVKVFVIFCNLKIAV